MKTISLLLLLMSNFFFSQITNLRSTKELTPEQLVKIFTPEKIEEISKGLNQEKYLKRLVKDTDNALKDLQIVHKEMSLKVDKQAEIITEKDKVIEQKDLVLTNTEIMRKEDIFQLKNEINIIEIQAKKQQKKSFWRGAKLGFITTVILTISSLYLIK